MDDINLDADDVARIREFRAAWDRSLKSYRSEDHEEASRLASVLALTLSCRVNAREKRLAREAARDADR